MKTLLKKEFNDSTSIDISEFENGRIASMVFAGDGGWVSQYHDKAFEEVCKLERLKIHQKLKEKSCTKSSLELLLSFNQTELF
ncbi:hypothetical protein OK18_15345 [Chryseobacterium gallinarum]|uniref:Uncharacterized protein n=1 Tax=Chryseobacterium gallinarum TaxID=1324352 RepID=A0A0G3M734_CHRGL|nr:hypothetical protein [Chryseobacterium gallinarum]AKK73798.1 hypothetical protein OK18_15345 [Chryseobacterium gallinarum]